MRYIYFSLFTFFSSFLVSQNLNLNKNMNNDINKFLYSEESNIHTSFKPILKSSFSFNIDSFLLSNYTNNNNKNKYLNKLFSNHLFTLSGEDYNVSVSPIVSFSKGIETVDNKSTFVNTRGYFVQGMLGKKISFSTSFCENLACKSATGFITPKL